MHLWCGVGELKEEEEGEEKTEEIAKRGREKGGEERDVMQLAYLLCLVSFALPFLAFFVFSLPISKQAAKSYV